MGNSGEVYIDIGGGGGEHFTELAKSHPNEKFLVLDPMIDPTLDKPTNLTMIKWKKDSSSEIPLLPNSVTEAHINFLMGELRTSDATDGSVAAEIKTFDNLLASIDRVLKSGGVLEIVDVQANINYIQDLLAKRGYSNTIPQYLEDKNRSEWTKAFFSMHAATGSRRDSLVVPMIIKAYKA